MVDSLSMFSVPLQYGYSVGLAIPLLLWMYVFWKHPEERKEILALSLLLSIASPLTQYLWWSVDWWYPPNITASRVGFEDVVLGFACGIIGVAYESVLRKRHVRIPKKQWRWQLNAHLLPIGVFVSNLGLISYFKFTSFEATLISLCVATFLIFYYRPDLIWDSVLSGVFVCLLSLTGYIPIMLFVPGWMEVTYSQGYLTGYLVGGIPVEELVFWFFAGMFFAPVYEYWKHERLRAIPTHNARR